VLSWIDGQFLIVVIVNTNVLGPIHTDANYSRELFARMFAVVRYVFERSRE